MYVLLLLLLLSAALIAAPLSPLLLLLLLLPFVYNFHTLFPTQITGGKRKGKGFLLIVFAHHSSVPFHILSLLLLLHVNFSLHGDFVVVDLI
jgi:hypothetical protein